MIKESRAKRAENFWSGGDLIVHGGGTQIFLDEGGGSPVYSRNPNSVFADVAYLTLCCD